MINTEALFYKIRKNIITPKDYVEWSYFMITQGKDNIPICIISSLLEPYNIFEIESYFKQAISELNYKELDLEICGRGYIRYLSQLILEGKCNLGDIFELAYEAFHVVAELDYPKDLIEWYYISEAIDQIYSTTPVPSDYIDNTKAQIIKEAKKHLE